MDDQGRRVAGHRDGRGEAWRDARGAVALLTRVPARADGSLSGARRFFPLVGLAVAGVSAAGWVAGDVLAGPGVAAVLAVAAGIAMTGALHHDGLADTADALWAPANVQDRLRILRDPRLGTYGVVTLVLTLGLQIALLAGLRRPEVARALVAGHVLGNASMLIVAARLEPARPGGFGARVVGPWTPAAAAVAVLSTLVPVVAATGVWAAVVLVAGAAAGTLVARLAQRRLHGFTGDVLGAVNVGVQVAVLVAVAAISRHGGGWWAI